MQLAQTRLGLHAAEDIRQQLPRQTRDKVEVLVFRDAFNLRTTVMVCAKGEGDTRAWTTQLEDGMRVPELFAAQLVLELL